MHLVAVGLCVGDRDTRALQERLGCLDVGRSMGVRQRVVRLGQCIAHAVPVSQCVVEHSLARGHCEELFLFHIRLLLKLISSSDALGARGRRAWIVRVARALGAGTPHLPLGRPHQVAPLVLVIDRVSDLVDPSNKRTVDCERKRVSIPCPVLASRVLGALRDLSHHIAQRKRLSRISQWQVLGL